MTTPSPDATPRIEDETERLETLLNQSTDGDHEPEDTAEAKAGETAKKLISLRIAPDDLALAKSLAAERNLGYQTLVCQILHEGLQQRDAERQARVLLAQIRQSLPALAVAQELANSPAVKAAQELLNSPAVKAAQALVSSPVIEAAEELANSPAVKAATEAAQGAAQNFTGSSAYKAAQGAAQNLADTPALKAALALASSSSGKLLRELVDSPAFKAAQAWVAPNSAAAATSESALVDELQQLQARMNEMEATLEKAGLRA